MVYLFTPNNNNLKKQSLLDIARMEGIPIPYACKGGGCGMCKIRITEGRYELGKCSKAVLPDEQRSKGYALACKTYPGGELKYEVVNDVPGGT